MLKALFVLIRFKFLSRLFWSCKKRFDKEAKVNFKIYYVTDWETITKHILPNIPRNKGNQTMKCGQLIEYNMKYFFKKKSFTRYSGEISPRPFYKVSKLN